jgi:hypothetical protein
VASQTPLPVAPAAVQLVARAAVVVAVAADSVVAAAVAAVDTAATARARCMRFPVQGAAALRAFPSSLEATSPSIAATASAPLLGDG